MGRTLTNSHRFQFKDFGSSSRIENPSISISESLNDARLPEELITQILLCLPVKSLLKFKCVSKPWLSLISSPQFIRSHFSKSCMEGEYLNLQLLFTIQDPAPGLKQCSLYSALHEPDPSTHVFDIGYPSPNPNYPPRIVGIVNGLVCLAINPNDLFMWNPVLRKSKLLPSLDDNLEGAFTSVNYGFGYDELNDDYKVVSLRTVYGSEEDDFEVKGRVYSLRSDSWRRIEDLKGVLPSYDSAVVYSNGKIYWSAFEPGESGDLIPKMKIISLDMVTEKYGEVKQPDYDPGHFNWKLGGLGVGPFVVCEYYDRKEVLWVMDKHGVEGSWCKVVSIPYDEVLHHQHVICILSNGDFVYDGGLGLLVYHSKHKGYRIIELDVGRSSYYKVVAYVESLVWPCG